jgi:hypothetical protein
MSRRSTSSYSSRFNPEIADDLSDNNAFPLRSLARNRSIQSRINTVSIVSEFQDDESEFVASPKAMKRAPGMGFWGNSRKSRDSDGVDDDRGDHTRLGIGEESTTDEYEGGYLSRGSVEQERLLRSSAGVDGAWSDTTEAVGHVRRPVSMTSNTLLIHLVA